MGRRTRAKKIKKKVIIISVSIIAFILAIGIGIYALSIQKEVNSWSNKIYPGIKINGVDLSAKTKEEAQKQLYDLFNKPINNKVLIVKADGSEFKLKYEELKPRLNIDETIQKALNQGKTGNIFIKNYKIKNGCNVNLLLKFSYDKNKAIDFENKIVQKINRKAKNASFYLEGSSPKVVEGTIGKEIDKKQLDELVIKNVNDKIDKNSIIEVNVKDVDPKVRTSDLRKIDGVIGSFSTSFATNSDESRATNLRVALKSINGILLMPGQEFSYNDALGERTWDRGYRMGAGYGEGGKTVQQIGGGICQISTTLYRAAMRAGIRSTERYNHCKPTSYSPLGLDATVSWGSLDYKFKNPYSFPIYIEGYATSDKQAVINIYGYVQGMGNKTYELIAGQVCNSGDDAIVSSYLETYEGGREINKEKIATDTYKVRE